MNELRINRIITDYLHQYPKLPIRHYWHKKFFLQWSMPLLRTIVSICYMAYLIITSIVFIKFRMMQQIHENIITSAKIF